MACHYHCDACGNHITPLEKYYIYYIVPLSENVSKYDFCKECMKKVTKFMKSLKEKK